MIEQLYMFWRLLRSYTADTVLFYVTDFTRTNIFLSECSFDIQMCFYTMKRIIDTYVCVLLNNKMNVTETLKLWH